MTRGSGRKTRTPGTFGSVDKRATGYRARYTGPDGRRHQAPTLFLAKKDARAWLALRHAEIVRGQWMPPGADEKPAPRLTLADYANQWLEHRDLKDRTREHYRKLLDAHIVPTSLGPLPLASITADDVRAWYAKLDRDTPTLRAHCYGLLRTIMGTAASDGKITANPCVIRGAGNAKRVHKIRPATLDELAKLVDAMPEKYRAMVLLASWCALRFGELTELRRRDVDIDEGVIRVRRGVVRVAEGFKETTPKSDAGVRDVAIPPHLLPAVRDHLVDHVAPGADSLLFPAQQGGHLAPATLYRRFYKAREAAGRPDLRFHDLRHSGAVLAAATGATLAELMGRLGHSTPAAALRYQHVAQGADKRIAEALSALAAAAGGGNV
ncbi:site-specific integrase [Mycobacterium avium]|uniref:site-specific integrase n=1 Tax=Mycobacterium avium TaxID=1764 RepID=UPI00079FDB26|nr:tyrosine-type recombinase/integrase [Mycobacterium avium]MBZ4508380.1 tyrosine-type recombinase/integrase [Mycobacterium avium subsp. hominissuis]MCA2295888.1 tyrosine-type recombinase/integrase family protein [Mycobacterium avium]WOF17903.1 tyrosine-type recombinase/integrase family protein [Mycobacterium avium]